MNPIIFVMQLCTSMMMLCSPVKGANSQMLRPEVLVDKQLMVEKVTNSVQIGPLAGNRNLEFGVKNILEEYLLEKEYELTPKARTKVRVEIIYLDVLTTKKNVSVFHSNDEAVVIRLQGVLVTDGKVGEQVVVEESSSEISMSTLLIDTGGKFNQTSLSNALKKASGTLISKLIP
jgi:hypothetical protein